MSATHGEMGDRRNGSTTPETTRLASLSVDERRRIVLETTDGRRHVGVEPIRAFPFTDPGHFIVFCDGDGREILCLDSIEDLDDSARRLLEEQLTLREFQPVIEQVLQVTGEGSPSEWLVQTDRGVTRLTLDNDDDVRRLDDQRVLVVDARKLRYIIEDLRTLDPHSRRLLERFL